MQVGYWGGRDVVSRRRQARRNQWIVRRAVSAAAIRNAGGIARWSGRQLYQGAKRAYNYARSRSAGYNALQKAYSVAGPRARGYRGRNGMKRRNRRKAYRNRMKLRMKYSNPYRIAGIGMRRRAHPFQVDKQEDAFTTTSSINQASYHTRRIGISSKHDSLMATGLTQLTAASTETIPSDKNNKLMVVGSKMNLKLKNNTGLTINITMYEITPRTSSSVDAEDAVATGLDDRAKGNNGWETKVYMHAENSPYFREKFVVLSRVNVQIQPGELYAKTVVAPWVVHNPDYYDQNSAPQHPGMTRILFWKQWGDIAHDETTTTAVGYGASQLDGIVTYTYTYGFVDKTSQRTDTITDSYGAVTSGVGVSMMDAEESKDDAV